MGELHLHVVTDLVAHRTVDEDVEVEVLVGERVVPSEREVGQGRTDVGLVVFVDNAVTIDITVLDIAYVGSILRVVLCGVCAPRLGAVGIGDDGVVLLKGVNG